jgi:mRNA interferase RelE/StbE
MARYSVIVRKSVSKDLKGIPKTDVLRILAVIESLADDPRPPGAKNFPAKNDTGSGKGTTAFCMRLKTTC